VISSSPLRRGLGTCFKKKKWGEKKPVLGGTVPGGKMGKIFKKREKAKGGKKYGKNRYGITKRKRGG